MKVEAGKTYQFNNAIAQVIEVSDKEVIWLEHRARSAFNLNTPRWFFEKYAAPLPNGDRA